MGNLLAIDPGNKESAFCVIRPWSDRYGPYAPERYDKLPNKELADRLLWEEIDYRDVVIEKAICRKWAGKEVSDTATWAGVFAGICKGVAHNDFGNVYLISRSKVRWFICGGRKANDSIIIDRLINRFIPGLYQRLERKEITRNAMLDLAKKGFFRDFHSDIWQAYALGVTCIDLLKAGERAHVEEI